MTVCWGKGNRVCLGPRGDVGFKVQGTVRVRSKGWEVCVWCATVILYVKVRDEHERGLAGSVVVSEDPALRMETWVTGLGCTGVCSTRWQGVGCFLCNRSKGYCLMTDNYRVCVSGGPGCWAPCVLRPEGSLGPVGRPCWGKAWL